MSTTNEKGLAFINVVSRVGHHVRLALSHARSGADLYSSLDVATWISEAEIDVEGNITGTTVTKQELQNAVESISGLIAFLNGGAVTEGEHLENMIRVMQTSDLGL